MYSRRNCRICSEEMSNETASYLILIIKPLIPLLWLGEYVLGEMIGESVVVKEGICVGELIGGGSVGV